MIKKIIFFILTIFFIIFSITAIIEFYKIFKDYTISSKIELSFLIGFVFYLFVHLIFYKPVFIHVMSHELTHAIWAFIFGGKTKKIEIASDGGKVLINKSNFLISLAPYFFPLYTMIFILIYLIAKEEYYPFLAFFIGASLSFHIALTLYSLKHEQSDLTEDSNIIFSYAFILFMNLLILILILSLIFSKISFIPFIKNTFLGMVKLIKLVIIKINHLFK
jgi:hypothetical protein